MLKKNLIISALFLGAVAFSGCKRDHNIVDEYDITPPQAPQNVSVLALDSEVEIYWDKSPDRDVAGYNVYYSYEYNGRYTFLGYAKNNYYLDGGANGPENGVKYFYAVTAYDYDGNESDLSGTYVFAIPRPEGYNIPLYDYNVYADKAGYDFSAYSILDYSAVNCDFFYEKYEGVSYIDVWDDSDIKDAGPTADITDITIAPVSGYAELIPGDNIKYVEAIEGHTYIIKTWDGHFAKIRVKQIASDKIIFDWAYQLIEDERMLKPAANRGRKKTYDSITINSR